MTQKRRDAPFLRIARGEPRNGTSVQFAGCITLGVSIAIQNWNRYH